MCSESREKHEAATKISLLYRYKKANRIVRAKRIQKEIEFNLDRQTKYIQSVIRIQTIVRMYSVRLWFLKRGVKFKVFNKKARAKRLDRVSVKVARSKLVTKADVRGRVQRDVNIRTVNNRKLLLSNLADLYSNTMQVELAVSG